MAGLAVLAASSAPARSALCVGGQPQRVRACGRGAPAAAAGTMVSVSAPTTAPARPLQIGPYRCATPVVLAPMAGITNAGFRRLCREQGAGFYVCEMITSRGLVERNPPTFRMIEFDADEYPRSLQLYGVDPVAMGRAVRMVVERDLADHIDMNFG